MMQPVNNNTIKDVPVSRSARMIILDSDHRLLLFQYHDEHRPPFWSTVGGRLLPGEDYLTAARRELLEETGFAAPIGRLLRTRDEVFQVAGSVPTRWIEQYFLVESAGGVPDRTNWTEEERSTIRDYRWWSLDEMRSTTETFLPAWLPELLESTLVQLAE